MPCLLIDDETAAWQVMEGDGRMVADCDGDLEDKALQAICSSSVDVLLVIRPPYLGSKSCCMCKGDLRGVFKDRGFLSEVFADDLAAESTKQKSKSIKSFGRDE